MESLIPILLICWAVFSFVSRQAQKKKKEEAARVARENAQQASPAPAPALPYYDDRGGRSAQQSGMRQSDRPEGGPPYYDAPAPRQPRFDPQTGARLAPDARPAARQMQQPPAARQAPPPVARQSAALQSRAQSNMSSTLTDIAKTRHPLEAFDRTGHAHQETSITGVQGECPPEREGKKAAPASAPAPVSAFRWNQNAVLSGLVYAEILSQPKALRRR